MEHPTHSTSVEVIEEGVSVDEQSGHSSVDECAPPPLVVFPSQLEVQQGHTDEGCDNQKQDEGAEKNSKQGVDLMSPHRSKDVVKLNVNCRKRQESGDDHLHEAGAVPWNLGGDFTCHLGCSCGSIKVVVGVILCNNSSQDG